MNIETKKWEVLCSEEQIASRLKELGAQISKDYEGKKLLVVSLLKGSFIFCADLVRNITVPVKIEFMTTSAVYIGGGQVVHASNSAPYPRGGIKISNVNYRTPICARRIIG